MKVFNDVLRRPVIYSILVEFMRKKCVTNSLASGGQSNNSKIKVIKNRDDQKSYYIELKNDTVQVHVLYVNTVHGFSNINVTLPP
jgi:hypothetical protein